MSHRLHAVAVWLSLLLVTASLAGCFDLTSPRFPALAVPVAAQPEYGVWWMLDEECAGVMGNLSAITWYAVPDSTSLMVDNQTVDGIWFSEGNRIVLRERFLASGGLVRHEMLHALLQSGTHPSRFFHDLCGDVVDCGRICSDFGPFSGPDLPGAIALTADQLGLTAWLTPSSPSRSQFGSAYSVSVSVRNPSSSPARVRLSSSHGIQGCVFGFTLQSTPPGTGYQSSCAYLNDTVMVFAAGEERRVVFDTNLLTGWDPFSPGRATLDAAFLSRSVRIGEVQIQP